MGGKQREKNEGKEGKERDWPKSGLDLPSLKCCYPEAPLASFVSELHNNQE